MDGIFLRARGSLKKMGFFHSAQIPLEQILAAIVDAPRGTPLIMTVTGSTPEVNALGERITSSLNRAPKD